MDNMNEMNLNEMENIVGGNGGSRTMLPEKEGFLVYKILPGENLTVIARKFNTTVDYLFAKNPTVTNRNFIRAGFYIYVPDRPVR